MYEDPATKKFILIGEMKIQMASTQNYLMSSYKSQLGTVQGSGYDCRKHAHEADVRLVEGSTNGLWSGVSYHVPWIRQTAAQMGEVICD